jgi:hypothetical protein
MAVALSEPAAALCAASAHAAPAGQTPCCAVAADCRLLMQPHCLLLLALLEAMLQKQT